MRKWILILVFVLMLFPLLAAKMDLNKATLAELRSLPITEKQAQDIYDYRTFLSFFKDIYQLRDIASIDQPTMLKLKNLVMVSHYEDKDDAALRRDEINSLMERLDSNEGAQEGMSDVWEDYLMTPQNVNQMHFDELLSLPNVSAIDASAVLKRQADGDTIADKRDLRNSPGISYYGATNLSNYVFYKQPPVKDRLFFDYQVKYESKSYQQEIEDMYRNSFLRYTYGTSAVNPQQADLNYWGYFHMEEYSPAVMNKLRVRYGNNWKLGFMTSQAKGEQTLRDMNLSDIVDDGKYYAGYEGNFDFFGPNKVKAYLGHYRVTYGEGLVMENTDYYNARKTGFGFSKRILGITPDLSRTDEYAMKGLAVEIGRPKLGAAFWYSKDKKDAVVYMDSVHTADGRILSVPARDANGNYKVLSYITSSRRFTDEESEDAEAFFNAELNATPSASWAVPYINLSPRKDILEETIVGGRLQASPIIGTQVGFTAYNSVYGNADFIVPDSEGLKTLMIRDSYNYDKWKNADAEMANSYSTYKEGDYDRDYRRVLGFDWTTTYKNTSFQGEYAELSVNGEDVKFGDDPGAVVMSAYTQYANLYFMTLYRHYDLGFDNPYSRSFSEHEKYDDSTLDKNVYTLTNPLLSDLFQNSVQSQAEQGIYFETRYRFNNYLTLNRTYLDIWKRLVDGRRSVRFQGELDYRPIFQMGLIFKYKDQVNRYEDDADRGVSRSIEYTPAIRAYLSNRDYLELEYRYNTVWGPPYVSLTNPAEGGENTQAQGMTLMNGDYMAVNYTHNFNDDFRISGSINFWNGHGITHWDWEDMEIDFMGDRGMKYWLAFHDRISDNLYVTLKYRYKHYRTLEYSIREYNVPVTGDNYYSRVEKDDHLIRLQLDWKF